MPTRWKKFERCSQPNAPAEPPKLGSVVKIGAETKSEEAKQTQNTMGTSRKMKATYADFDTYHTAIATVNKMKQFQDLANTDPAALKAAAKDPTSAYNQALGMALGVTPKEARRIRAFVRRKIKKLVEKVEAVKTMYFVYVCPFCGGTDSPTCAFKDYSKEWKIEHSLKKPWTETAEVKTVVEEEEEIEEEVDL